MNSDVITYRKACLSDLDAIVKIETRSFREDAFSQRQLKYLIRDAKGAFIAAVLGGIVVGYVSVLTSIKRNGRIYSLAIDFDWRGQGIAESLLDMALVFLRDQHMRSVFLEVAVDNQAAISLYEKKHFIKRSIRHQYYHSGADAYSMLLILSDRTVKERRICDDSCNGR